MNSIHGVTVEYPSGVTLSHGTSFFRTAESIFPELVSPGHSAIDWLQSDIEGWVRNRVISDEERNERGALRNSMRQR
jgi:predicted DNA-binding transcriptional regulator AlpA